MSQGKRTPVRDLLASCRGFEWDEANADKNWFRHQVTRLEAEQVFFNRPLVSGTARTVGNEKRFAVLGLTMAGRPLFVVFTIRKRLIRVISARNMKRSERGVYDHAKQQDEEDPQVS